jgi:hypothetical protein
VDLDHRLAVADGACRNRGFLADNVGSALVALAFCLMAIWSIGSLLAILTCFQLAAAVALRRAVEGRGWAALLIAAPIAFLLVVYGLAILQAERFWPIAFPLAFALGALLLIGDFPARLRHPLPQR